MRIPGGWRTKCLDLLARCWLALGRREEAERAAACAEARAEAVPLQMAVAMALRARAAVLLESSLHSPPRQRSHPPSLRGRPAYPSRPRSRACWRGARWPQQASTSVPSPSSSAPQTSCTSTVRCAIATRRSVSSASSAVRSTRHARRTDTEETGVATLSRRELEVARLVVDRKTNPEIAAALFLSQKTVESHLRNMFSKLGVASRVELARAIVRADGEARTP